MKYTLLLPFYLLIAFCTNLSTSTADKKQVQDLITEFNKRLKNSDYEGVYNMTYPNSFGSSTKKEVLDDLKSSMKNEDYELQINQFFVDSISEVYKFNSDKYARVDHRLAGTVLLKLKGDTSSIRQSFDDYCLKFRNEYGAINVKCDAVHNSLQIIFRDYSFAIYVASMNKWFLVNADNVRKISGLIPEEIKQKLNYQIIQ